MTATTELNSPLIAVMAMSLKTLDNQTLAACNNAVQWLGKVPPQNIAHKTLFDLSLVLADGSIPAVEEFKSACAFEVNRRVEAGIFN